MNSAFVRRNARRLRRLTGAALACNLLALGWTWVWTAPDRTWLLTMALLAAGCCTAALLWRLYRALGETAERTKKTCWEECL